jgi:hypothetical protein
MPYISSIVATFLGLALGLLLLTGQFAASPKFWTVFASIYAVVVVVAGWAYATSRARVFGWIHALLMFGVAGVCGAYGFSVLGDRSIPGGRGPDANPVAGVIYGFGFLGALIALVTAACGVAVISHVLRKQKVPEPVA